MQRPLATVVVFGLTISTLVTLVYIPVLYMHMNRLRSFFGKLLKKKEAPPSAEGETEAGGDEKAKPTESDTSEPKAVTEAEISETKTKPTTKTEQETESTETTGH